MLTVFQRTPNFCRDLCARANALVVSLDFRRAPEARFPAAVEDAFAAVQGMAAHAESLGGRPGGLALCGWSAGANLAAVVCQLARDAGGPRIDGQVLVAPLVDADFTRRSYQDNAEGYLLTTALMPWFWDHDAAPANAGILGQYPCSLRTCATCRPLMVCASMRGSQRSSGRFAVPAS